MADEKRTVGIVGASGFIGGEVARQASALGWRVVGFSRSPQEPGDGINEWRKWSEVPDLSGLRVVVNLAGEPVDQRWTESAKRRFHESRVGVTEILTRAMLTSPVPVLINGSAVGFYGDRGDEVLDESAAAGDGYLADLCREWESAADAAPDATRVVKLRTGVVLGSGGAAWKKMRTVFGFGLGGRFGDGRQWMPWIHVADLAGGIVHLLDADLDGSVNGSAPEPERNAEFTRKLASALNRPAFFHAPAWGLKLGLGDFASALLASQRAVPNALLRSGFRFRYPTLESALAELV
ncbi:NAD dependent epimerase/dehydratase family protein [Haloferula helveola]|uniref:NAD dependent epimerase/dehydratase family protein n=1 Tax=Haloferula helveola TaxID=490095 RepID=A0ABN6H7U2_9BACT|nr:NAD dependent epimerase/dehydratase family protein [Haloferula helveola]